MFKYKEEYGWLTHICLNLTDACPLACVYCFVEQHPHYMTLEVAKSAVNFILKNLEKKRKNNPEERASITYFGGEPTLMWDEIIVPLTNWVRENDYPIDFTITTNGVLLNKERIQFLKDNNITPLLSIDGDKATQNYNRPRHDGSGSFDAVSAIIPDLLEAFPNTTFRATIWPETAQYTFENYIFAIRQGFKNVFFIPDCRHSWSVEKQQILEQEIHKIFSFIDFCFTNDIQPPSFSTIEDTYSNMLQLDLLKYHHQIKELFLQRNFFRCGLGTTFGSIGYDGSIYGCQEQPSKKNNIFYLGNINKQGIEAERHKKLLSTYHQEAKIQCEEPQLCEQCILRKNCTQTDCPSSAYDLHNNFFIASKINCLWKQWFLESAIVLNNKMVTDNNMLFKNYLDKACGFNQQLKKERKECM